MKAVLSRVIAPAVALALVLPATAAAAPLDNDNWQSPQFLDYFDRDAAADQTNAGATIQNPEPLTANDPDLGVCSGSKLSHTIWYEVPGNGGRVTVHTRGSAVDTIVVVYDTDTSPGSPAPSFDNAIDCNDDISDDERTSEVTFNTQDGVDYLVQVGGCSGCGLAEEGRVEFVAYDAPPNDNRASALQINAGAPRAGDNYGATVETGERQACGTVPFGKTVWYRYHAAGEGTAIFSTSGIDTVLAAYRGSTFVGCNDDGPGQALASRLEIPVTAGDYFVQVGGFGTGRAADFGGITTQVEFRPKPIPPDPDRDGDGVIDRLDKCPDASGAARDANRDGCLDPDPDPDGDGVPAPRDKCPAQNSRARDKDGDGCLDPLPHKRISANARLRAKATAAGIRVVWLKVVAPRGSKVTVRCGKGCRFAKRASASTDVLATAARTLRVKKLSGRSFRAGQKIRVYVTKKNRIGAYFQYTVKRGDFKRIQRCLNPGSTKPRKTCR